MMNLRQRRWEMAKVGDAEFNAVRACFFDTTQCDACSTMASLLGVQLYMQSR